MKIPSRNVEKFAAELVTECLGDQRDRIGRGQFYKNFFLYGSENPSEFALYKKIAAYIDEVQSLLYSPVSLRFRLSDLDDASVLAETKFRRAAAQLRQTARRSSTDTMISEAVLWSLVKGKAFLKHKPEADGLHCSLVQPETMGVLRPNHTQLDSDMEAFTHSTLITTYQFERLIEGRGDAARLRERAKRTMQLGNEDLAEAAGGMPVIVGGLYPFQQAGSGQGTVRGIVDWMGGPAPRLSASMMRSLLRLDELWVWNDAERDWCTMQLIGGAVLIFGRYRNANILSENPLTGKPYEPLRGRHPFSEYCVNPLADSFWGLSEITFVAALQRAINSRITGINGLLRRQEDPPQKFRGVAGVNQVALSRLRKPGGYWSDSNPQADVANLAPEITESLWGSLHEYERMFDEMGGLPPISKGKGEAGVRSQGHAQTLVQMFTPRFKDRALLVERSVEATGALMVDISRAHAPEKMTAWVPTKEAGMEAAPDVELIKAPAPGLSPVRFAFADLPDDISLTIDSHSASPAFQADARALVFDLFKIGAASATDVIEHVDSPDPETLIAGVERREAAKSAEIAQLAEQDPRAALKAVEGGKRR